MLETQTPFFTAPQPPIISSGDSSSTFSSTPQQRHLLPTLYPRMSVHSWCMMGSEVQEQSQRNTRRSNTTMYSTSSTYSWWPAFRVESLEAGWGLRAVIDDPAVWVETPLPEAPAKCLCHAHHTRIPHTRPGYTPVSPAAPRPL